MDSRLLLILAFLTVELAVSHGALSPELYWKAVLPNTAMPKAIRDLVEVQSISTNEVKNGKWVGKTDATFNGYSGGGRRSYMLAASENEAKSGKWVGQTDSTFNGYSGGGRRSYMVAATENEVKSASWVGQTDATFNGYSGGGRRHYNLAATDNQNPDHLSLFFLEKDIHTGSLMTLDFTTNPNKGPSFLPRKEANSIPFSSTQFPQIMNLFSMKPESKEAKVMKNTIEECERPAMKGEEKYCATSLESMVDFITSKVGENVVAISTETKGTVNKVQKYSITDGLVKMSKNNIDNVVVCHRENYPYAVFYCHALVKTRAYVVPMVGSNGTKVKAVAVCHTDTSEWNPKHLAFQMLKVKPGTFSICHFLQPQQLTVLPKN